MIPFLEITSSQGRCRNLNHIILGETERPVFFPPSEDSPCFFEQATWAQRCLCFDQAFPFPCGIVKWESRSSDLVFWLIYFHTCSSGEPLVVEENLFDGLTTSFNHYRSLLMKVLFIWWHFKYRYRECIFRSQIPALQCRIDRVGRMAGGHGRARPCL